MKTVLLSGLLSVLVLNSSELRAQTTLALGDVAFTGYNSDAAPKEFSFILLKNITPGTTINFTNTGWSSGACGSAGWGVFGEGECQWSTVSNLPYGTQIRISGLTSSTGTVTGSALNLSTNGDQIFALQGPRTGSYVMLAGIHMNQEPTPTGPANWDGVGSPSSNQSNLPSCLTNGGTALYINPEVDNAVLNTLGFYLTGNPATDRAYINDAANWNTDNVTPFLLPPALSLVLPVQFTYIKASGNRQRITVEWGAEEQGITKYIIERSADGMNFSEAGTVLATQQHTYIWNDLQPLNGDNYYRVRAVETSGILKYSSTVRVNLSQTNAGIAVYPMPVKNNQFTLQMNNIGKGTFTMSLYNITGQQVMSKTIVHNGDNSTQTIQLQQNVSAGIYKLILKNGGQHFSTTITIE